MRIFSKIRDVRESNAFFLESCLFGVILDCFLTDEYLNRESLKAKAREILPKDSKWLIDNQDQFNGKVTKMLQLELLEEKYNMDNKIVLGVTESGRKVRTSRELFSSGIHSMYSWQIKLLTKIILLLTVIMAAFTLVSVVRFY